MRDTFESILQRCFRRPQPQAQAGADPGQAEAPAPPPEAEAQAAAEASMWKQKHNVWRGALDTVLFVSVLGLLAVVEYGYVPSPRVGFYCNDPKIAFKFSGDTVTLAVLMSGSFIFPLLVLWAVEAGLVRAHRGGGLLSCLRHALRPAGRWYREFLLGMAVVLFITDAAKLLVSEPRPHFLDTCRPDAAFNCSSPSQWIDNFSCTNKMDSAWSVRDSMRSFPSGHTSLSVYMALFVMLFLRRRMPAVSLLLMPWLQGLFLLWALVCSLTRITDHRHHWWDVLAGCIVGVTSAIYTVRIFCDDFRPRHSTDDDSLSSSPGPGSKGRPEQPLLNGHVTPSEGPDGAPARRLLSSSSSCASSLTAEERELREVATT